MIFVYPALISKNCDARIVPVTCRAIEKYFLIQLQEAFTSGTLGLKKEEDPRTGGYGPLQLESSDKLSRIEKDIDEGMPDIDAISKSWKVLQKQALEASKYFDEMAFALDDYAARYLKRTGEVATATNSKLGFWEKRRAEASQKLTDAQQKINQFKKDVLDIGTLSKIEDNKIKNKLLVIGQEVKNTELAIKQDEIKSEKIKGERAQKERHGSYQAIPFQGVSLEPTTANIRVLIHYIGSKEDYRGSSLKDKEQDVAIGCKVIPFKLSNFDELQNALLDDYFSNSFALKAKSVLRLFVSKAMRFVEKWTKRAGVDVDIMGKLSPINRDIRYAPKGFFDASSFTRRSNSPEFYNYSSAIVIFNKDDINKTEEENFFLNAQKLKLMFKAGWNTFCVLDPVQEEAIFVSMIDGGYAHTLPYSYLFNSLKMDNIYTSFDALKRSASPFFRHSGNIRNIGKKLLKESIFLKSIKQFLRK